MASSYTEMISEAAAEITTQKKPESFKEKRTRKGLTYAFDKTVPIITTDQRTACKVSHIVI